MKRQNVEMSRSQQKGTEARRHGGTKYRSDEATERCRTTAFAIRYSAFAILWAVASASAQSGGGYSITKSTIDSGGGTVSGGGYVLTGTAGQHDAGPASNGGYTLSGGFWSPATACPASSAAQPELIGSLESTKNRFLSFTAGDAGRSQAVRVRFDSLLPPFDLWNGAELWVGPPAAVSETAAQVAPGGGPTFTAARFQCMPHYMDWSATGTIHVFHEGIVPAGNYRIDVIDAACNAGSAASYSAALPMTTAVNGDTVADLSVDPPLPPNGPPIDVTDALAVLERFANAAGAIIKARADLEPGCLDLVINVSDVLMSLRGFAGLGYSFAPTAPDPCASTCINPLP